MLHLLLSLQANPLNLHQGLSCHESETTLCLAYKSRLLGEDLQTLNIIIWLVELAEGGSPGLKSCLKSWIQGKKYQRLRDFEMSLTPPWHPGAVAFITFSPGICSSMVCVSVKGEDLTGGFNFDTNNNFHVGFIFQNLLFTSYFYLVLGSAIVYLSFIFPFPLRNI